MNFNTYINTLQQKGNLAYEYNPFYNYQTNEDLYLVNDTYIVPKGKAVNLKNGEILTKVNGVWKDKRGQVITDNYVEAESGTEYARAGSIIDLETDQLNFDLDHPVDIEIQPSYDGSVNLILNDNKNVPRLINSRFSVREKNTYEIVDRIGENDTNIYNSDTFQNDTSLYFQYTTIPKIDYIQQNSGYLPVGQYCFYVTYCDSDGNESDIVAETGLIPVFIGGDGIPFSMDGGIKNQDSGKGILLEIKNFDASYNYIKLKYVRYFADYQQNRVYEGKSIIKKYEISNQEFVFITITGHEEVEDFDPNILNIQRFNPKHILTQAQCKNMLFFGNITKITDNYRELSDLSLRIIPEIANTTLDNQIDIDYNGEGYYSTQNMYYKVGYFNQEYYSFGVVYIYDNGTLSNVYPTLGMRLDDEKLSNKIPVYQSTDNDALLKRQYIRVDNDGWITENELLDGYNNHYLNAKGVCKFDYKEAYDDNTIFNIKFNIPEEVSKYLKEELGIKGYFFVRQKCTPNILAQCYLMPFDEQLKAPVLEEVIDNQKRYYTECFVTQKKTSVEKYEFRFPWGDRTIIGENSEVLIQPLRVEHTYDARLYGDSEIIENGKSKTEYEKYISKQCYAAICPDFLLNQPYYNQIFNSQEFSIQKVSSNSNLSRDGRFWKEAKNVSYDENNSSFNKVTLCSVTEDVPTVAIKDKIFKLKKGMAEEAFRFEYAGYNSGEYSAGDDDTSKAYEATNIVRGMYSPFVAVYSSNSKLETGCLYNIYKNISDERQNFLDRMKLGQAYYAISDRANLIMQDQVVECFRGDCYINNFTYRLNRNFNDPSLPNNDDIIEPETWKNNYGADSTKWNKISKSDLNAVRMGSWITFKCRSAYNYALRSEDHSYVSEEALMGAPRSFYPRSELLELGENKMPDSYLFNDAYRATLGYKCYFSLGDINYIKDNFSNRIQYSAIAIQDSFKNNYRESLSTYFRDYSMEYGSIQKLVPFEGYLLVIFEHGIAIATVNERVLASEGNGNPVFINTQNVLPEELAIISDMFGTQWPDSVIKTDSGAVYGVDTIAKKIWRVQGQQLEILSDFKVGKFLIDNISLSERELFPTIGLKNVKTHYNANKKDIMFTFYDDVYKDEEKVWNLCFNELLNMFVTFYSWVPSFSENIDTQYFSFNRDTSKKLALLNKCSYSIPENSGILLDSTIVSTQNNPIQYPRLYYRYIQKVYKTIENKDGTVSEKTYVVQDNIINDVNYTIEKDHWGYYKYFKIVPINKKDPVTGEDTDEIEAVLGYQLALNDNISDNDVINIFKKEKGNQSVILLYITPSFLEDGDIKNIMSGTSIDNLQKTQVVAFTLDKVIENPLLHSLDDEDYTNMTTDFYLHGRAGIFNIKETYKPTFWYSEQHPFEFEFIVNENVGYQKIYNNLLLISNKAEPESFHFEIEGDNYEFSPDKRAMYFRQESTKELFQNLGSNMLYDRDYTDVIADQYTQEQYYWTGKNAKRDMYYPTEQSGLVQQIKSTIFPLYYQRIDTYNEIYDTYRTMLDESGDYDFKNLSGSEIKWYRDLNQFNIVTHIKNSPINLVGRLRGNSYYKEGKWNIQIPSIIFSQKNEEDWKDILQKNGENVTGTDGETVKIPPIVINSDNVPNDLTDSRISKDKLPNIYRYDEDISGYISVGDWTYRKETQIRDKWIKIRIRYSGKNLAIIHSIATLYSISYA